MSANEFPYSWPPNHDCIMALLLSNQGKANKIKIEENEIQAEIQKQLRMMPGQEKFLMEYYQKNPSAVASLRGNIYQEKIINSIISKSKASRKKISKVEAERLIKEQNEKDLKEVKQSNKSTSEMKTKKADISKKSPQVKKKTAKKLAKSKYKLYKGVESVYDI